MAMSDVVDYWVQEAVDLVKQYHEDMGTVDEVNLSLITLAEALVRKATAYSKSATLCADWAMDELHTVSLALMDEQEVGRADG